ncbi:chaplin [Kitasatospora sp. NPDC004240]
MQNVKKAAVLSAAAASMLLAGAGSAVASSGAEGVAAGSPGVVSGNQLQVPVHIPVNLCGNTVNVVGLLNPAFGNHCANIEAAPPVKQEEDC